MSRFILKIAVFRGVRNWKGIMTVVIALWPAILLKLRRIEAATQDM